MMGLTFDDVTESKDARTTQNTQGDVNAFQLSSIPDAATSKGLIPLPLTESLQKASSVDKQFCGLLVVYDTCDNPYRKLIPLISSFPLLADAIAASSACHYAFNDISNQNLSVLPPISESSWAFPATPSQDPTVQLVAKDLPESLAISPAYEHTLRFKHRALHRLSESLNDPIKRADDRTPAAILLLIMLDSLESGGGAWRSHLEGAKTLLQDRSRVSALAQRPDGAQTHAMVKELVSFVIDTCVEIEIMGSTLARSRGYTVPLYFQLKDFTTLERLEQTSFVGCPAYLLEVILFVHSLRHSYLEPSPSMRPSDFMAGFTATGGSQSDKSDLPSTLLDYIRSFDPASWAEDKRITSGVLGYESRFHAASAYKIAVYLYAARVKSTKIPPQQHDEEVNDLIQHIVAIPSTDEVVKCTIWPTFIAGAESNTQEQRQTVLANLDKLWNIILSANVRSASMVLKTLWRKQDEMRQEQQGNGGDGVNEELPFNWIQELDRTKGNWLFI
ncbi:hypothetical protein FQN54_006103 [Arachnomyces sp. PD_36]|nr:hypothetical protein FQN54_006103 [Arachnomyces sp. PD_36]